MSISGETIGQQTAKTYEEALNGNAVTALQIGTGKGKLPVSQLAPSCIETTDVTQLSFSDIKFALDTGRTIVCATNWGHAAFHVHNDLLVEGQPDVYRLTADVGGKTLMYTMTTSDGGETCTWSTLKVIPTIGSELEESDSYIVCQLSDGVWNNDGYDYFWYDQNLDASERHNMETGRWTSISGENLQSYFKIKAGHVYQVNWSMSVSVATTYPGTILQGRVFFTGPLSSREVHNFDVDFSRVSYNTINGSFVTVGDGGWLSYNVEMYKEYDENFIMPSIYFNDFSIVDVTSKVLGCAEVVWDYYNSDNRPSFAEVRDAMMNGAKAYIKDIGAVVGYYDYNQKSTPTSECTQPLNLFVFELGDGDDFGLPYIEVIVFSPTSSAYNAHQFQLQETHLIKYPSNKYLQLVDLAAGFEASSTEANSHKCRSCFIADLDDASHAPVQPVSSMRRLESGDTIFGRTLDQRAILVSSLDPVAEVINHYLFYYDETEEKFSRKLTATDV